MQFYRFDMGAAAERQKKLPVSLRLSPGAFFALGTRGRGNRASRGAFFAESEERIYKGGWTGRRPGRPAG